jgi:3-methyladenine DNA glycosylase AlkD
VPATPPTADDFLTALAAVRSDAELAAVRRRLPADEPAIGVRMRELFDAAKAARAMPLEQVAALFADPRYEARLGAVCVLDFKAKAPRVGADERRAYYELWMAHLDRITTWDMVDRGAPSVLGGHLLGRPLDPLVELARAAQPVRRRTAITAPLWFVRHGGDDALAPVLDLAALLADDPDPVVHKAVGIALKHLGGRDPAAVARFLDAHAAGMARAAVRLAADKLDPATRARFVR